MSYLTEALVDLGHDVTLFASGDSITSAELVPCCDEAIRLNPAVVDPLPYHMMMLDEVRRRADEFDVLHFHIDVLQFPLLRSLAASSVTTMHSRLDIPDLAMFYRRFSDIPVVSISNHQRRPLPGINWQGTVHHGLPKDLLRFQPAPRGDYLAFLGRIAPEKGPDRAIEIARRTGVKLRIAAKVDKADERYWRERIKPMLDECPEAEYIGEIGEADKAEFLGNARALLFPIDWPEPFGLVIIEALACGTPVIAFRRGSVPEIIDDGLNGFIVESVDEAAGAVSLLDTLSRKCARQSFEQYFTAERMASDYLAIYANLAKGRRNAARAIFDATTNDLGTPEAEPVTG